jgi:site-specific DNA-methyltransferase (adenine-specific)
LKPYYEHAGITIYHGDCRDVLPQITDYQVFVTDPPYGVNFTGKETKSTISTVGYTIGDDQEIGPWVVREVLKRAARGLVFPGTRQMFKYPQPADIGCVFCPAGAGLGRWGFTLFHPVLYYGKCPTTQSGMASASITSFATSDIEGHPCPKPLAWMKWAVKRVTLEGETVIDPLAGSGTTLEAAKILGFRAIGIEIEERYCEIAAKRLSQEVLAFT